MDRNTDIHTRETRRRRTLWRLAGLLPGDPAALELILALDEIDLAEINDASSVTKLLDVEELRVQVLAEDHACGFSIVRAQNIPQPWRSRFLAASIGATRVAEGFYAHDWHSFLRRWQAEMIHLDRHRSAGTKSTS